MRRKRRRPRTRLAHRECFEVADLQASVDGLAADGHGLVDGIGQHEDIWRMAYVRGTEGIIVSLAERIG